MSMWEEAGGLREGWYAAGLSEQVTSRRPLGRVILERPVVLWRTRGGAPVAMEDRCAHRNARLSEGDVLGDRIGCPYHGWTYDASGRCVEVPSRGPGGLPVVDCQLATYHVTESDGLVWVWMGAGEPTREPFAMPRYRERGWGAYYMETEFENGVTNLVENFMDVPHTVFVHRGWFRRACKTPVRTTVERTTDSVLVTYHQPADSIGVSGRILNPRDEPMHHTDKFYMPNITRVDYEFGTGRAFIITSTCTPERPFFTRVFTLISYRLGPLNPAAKLLLPWYTRQVIEQDVRIMKNQGDNLRLHGGIPRFRNTEADILHEHIESLRDAAQADRPPPAPRTDEITFYI